MDEGEKKGRKEGEEGVCWGVKGTRWIVKSELGEKTYLTLANEG